MDKMDKIDKKIELIFKRTFNINEDVSIEDFDRDILDKWMVFKLNMRNFADECIMDCMKRNKCI